MRIALGAVYMYAAVKYNKKSANLNKSKRLKDKDKNKNKNKNKKEELVASGVLSSLGGWASTFVLCFISMVWMTR